MELPFVVLWAGVLGMMGILLLEKEKKLSRLLKAILRARRNMVKYISSLISKKPRPVVKYLKRLVLFMRLMISRGEPEDAKF